MQEGGSGMDNHSIPYDKNWRPRPDRRQLVFWWPAALFLGIMALLWSNGWSHFAGRRTDPSPRLPELGAAYVVVGADAQALYLKADIIARPSWLGFGRTVGDSLDARETAPEPTPPPLHLLPVGHSASWQPAHLDIAARLGDPAERTLAAPIWTAPLSSNTLSLRLASALQQAGFTSSVTRAHLPATAGRLRVWLELDEAGRITHALGERDEGELPQEALRVIQSGGGTNAATGWIDLAWPTGSGK